jgi:hypothetical protein
MRCASGPCHWLVVAASPFDAREARPRALRATDGLKGCRLDVYVLLF